MKLVKNWKKIAAKSHSMWAFYLSVIFLIAPELIYLMFGRDTNPRVWWIIALACLIYGIFGRLKDQGIDRANSPAWVSFAAVIAVGFFAWSQGWNDALDRDKTFQIAAVDNFQDIAIPFIGGMEGLRLKAYQDVAGVWTVCYGETKGVKAGDAFTKERCDAMFVRRIGEFRRGIHGYFTTETIETRLPPPRDVAFTSLAYNVGVIGAGKSTATRRLNAGNIAGACEALTWWNRAGGRVIRGLVNRRAAEQELCLRDA